MMETKIQRGKPPRRRFLLLVGAFVVASAGAIVGLVVPVTQASANYNGSAAASWATANAKDPQFNGDECAWFVSQALWAGGLPQSSQWTGTGSHPRGHIPGNLPGSETAWVVPELVSYLKAHFSVTETSLGNMSVNSVPQAAIGDIIVYSWDSGTTLQHMSIITGFASGDYPLVSEMGQFDWNFEHFYYNIVNPISTYVQRGWTWSQSTGQYLESELNGTARAYLIHFNSSTPFAAPSTQYPASSTITTSPPPNTASPNPNTESATTTTTTSPPSNTAPPIANAESATTSTSTTTTTSPPSNSTPQMTNQCGAQSGRDLNLDVVSEGGGPTINVYEVLPDCRPSYVGTASNGNALFMQTEIGSSWVVTDASTGSELRAWTVSYMPDSTQWEEDFCPSDLEGTCMSNSGAPGYVNPH